MKTTQPNWKKHSGNTPVLLLLITTMVSLPALAVGSSSASHAIPWHTFSAGSGPSSSASYRLFGSIGEPATGGESTSTGYVLRGGFLTLALPDSEADGVSDFTDNCTMVSNPSQLDVDNDGFGNICDPDFNNDDNINFGDLIHLKSLWLSGDPEVDLNADGTVNFGDLIIMKSMWLQPPGPAGLIP